MNPPSRVFRYAFDPVCIGSISLYALERFVLRPHNLGGSFVHDYLSDVLCLPIFLPVILYLQRRAHLRRHDGPPRAWEVMQAWIVFSIIFEVILPRLPHYFRSTSDPLDVLAYFAGGAIAYLWWNNHVSHSCEAPQGDRQTYIRSKSRALFNGEAHEESQVVSPS